MSCGDNNVVKGGIIDRDPYVILQIVTGTVKYILCECSGAVEEFDQVDLRLGYCGDGDQFLQLHLPDVCRGYTLCQNVFDVLVGGRRLVSRGRTQTTMASTAGLGVL